MGQDLQQYLEDKVPWQTRYLISRVRKEAGLASQGSVWALWPCDYVTKLF